MLRAMNSGDSSLGYFLGTFFSSSNNTQPKSLLKSFSILNAGELGLLSFFIDIAEKCLFFLIFLRL